MVEILVAFTIAFESSSESLECQMWVAKTIQVRSDERKISPKEVVFQKNQFSCWDEEGQPTQERILTDKEISTAITAWKRNTEIEERPNLYCNHDCYPSWRKSDKVTFLRRIDNLCFFREER